MENKYNIGTVVSITNHKEKFIIVGNYYDEKSHLNYYIVLNYPEGFSSEEEIFLVNPKNILKKYSNKDNNFITKLLPLGSIVKVRFELDTFLIIGYYPKINNHIAYEYIAINYPGGINKSENLTFINSKYIKEIKLLGYCDESSKKFIDLIYSQYSGENL